MKRKQRWADLHIHTVKSDGTDTVLSVFEQAKSAGIEAVAITDHDTVAGIDEAERIKKKFGIEFVPAVELSAIYEGREVHMLGLFIDWKDKVFREKLTYFQNKRMERAKKIIRKLKALNIDINFEELYEFTENVNNAGRLHVAKLLVHKKVVTNIKDAFNKYLSEERPAYVAKAKLAVKEAINLIKDVNGISIIAHPGILDRDDMIEKWKAIGLDGIEAYHPDHSYDRTGKYLDLAVKNDMLVSGGSDSHGASKDYTKLGKVKLPFEYYEKLKEAAGAAKKKSREQQNA